MASLTTLHHPGLRVRVVQQIPHGDRVWTKEVVGTIVTAHRAKTGSWFAHAKDDQLWLDRLELRLDDGELVQLNLDQYSVIERADAADEGEAA